MQICVGEEDLIVSLTTWTQNGCHLSRLDGSIKVCENFNWIQRGFHRFRLLGLAQVLLLVLLLLVALLHLVHLVLVVLHASRRGGRRGGRRVLVNALTRQEVRKDLVEKVDLLVPLGFDFVAQI